MATWENDSPGTRSCSILHRNMNAPMGSLTPVCTEELGKFLDDCLLSLGMCKAHRHSQGTSPTWPRSSVCAIPPCSEMAILLCIQQFLNQCIWYQWRRQQRSGWSTLNPLHLKQGLFWVMNAIWFQKVIDKLSEWGTFRTPFLCFQGQGELGVLKFSFLSCTRDPVFLSCSLMNTSHPPPFAAFFLDKGDYIISQGLLDKDLGLPSRLDSRNRQIDVALTLRTLDYSGRGTRSKLMNKIATRWGKKIHNEAGICDGQRPVGQEGQKVTFKEDNEEWESPSIGF